MKHNVTVTKTIYDAQGTRIHFTEIATWQVWLPPDKPITSNAGEMIVAEKFCKWLEKFTRTAITGLSLDVSMPIIDQYGHELTAVYSLV